MTDSQIPYLNIRQLLAERGEYVSLVSGVSMYPMLRYKKDPVLIHPINRALKKYDLVLYAKGEQYVIHRILKVCDNHYVIRGDNCIGKEFIPKEDILGLIVGFWRGSHYISVENILYRIYAKFWVFLNPLLRLSRKLQSYLLKVKNNCKL